MNEINVNNQSSTEMENESGNARNDKSFTIRIPRPLRFFASTSIFVVFVGFVSDRRWRCSFISC